MKQFYFIILFILLFACKKEPSLLITHTPIFGLSEIDIDTSLIAKYNSKPLMLFYKNYGLKTVWQSENFRKNILGELSKSNLDGLEPNDYAILKLSDYEKNIKTLQDSAVVNYDILLTNSLQNYLKHISTGKLNPKEIYTDWDLKPKEIDINNIIFKAYKNENFLAAFDEIKPKNPAYGNLKDALKIIDALPEDYSIPMKIGTKKKLQFKDKNALLIPIKKRLIYWNYLIKKDSLSNIYDTKTKKAIIEFQTNHGLLSDGIIGTSTISALNLNKSVRREQIIANLERWRWFPDYFGKHYSIVNIPEYRLKIVKDSVVVDTFNVIVGMLKRRSPVFTTKLNQVIFNPTWTVPPTIIKEDLIPDATKSRSYFTKNRIKIFNYKKKQISPWEWKPENSKKYDYVQDAGKGNTLGTVKIIFPNKFSVYLHDTNHKAGFAMNFRSLSSGCTRVENPLRFAKYLLNDTINYNDAKIDTILKHQKTTPIKIKQDILHYQLYYTAWYKKNHLCFRDDIYNLDADLYCQLRH
jgi:L,D-transpeptidase YcbB